ncbi:MAG: N-acetylneuraminate synthase family protein [Planctomycetota bacterium]
MRAPTGRPAPARQTVEVGGHAIGRDFVIIAGPCAVESAEQTLEAARRVKAAGGHLLRGGAFKPRTSVMDARDIEKVSACADLLQVGSRNMQNYTLLKELGRAERPVLLKRGMSATLEEWLGAACYILAGGNERVILCERGIRTFETSTRNTLDLSVVPALKAQSPLPVIVDPSHGTGRADLIHPMSLAAVAAGADGLLVEVHPDPSRAKSDRRQQITPEAFAGLVRSVSDLVSHLRAR